jgi:hypothetical protein
MTLTLVILLILIVGSILYAVRSRYTDTKYRYILERVNNNGMPNKKIYGWYLHSPIVGKSFTFYSKGTEQGTYDTHKTSGVLTLEHDEHYNTYIFKTYSGSEYKLRPLYGPLPTNLAIRP